RGITDEEARINVNTATPDRIESLLISMGLDKQVRDVVGDSLQDWKDPDDLHRANGAESEDYYLKLPVPYRARNGALQDTAELLQIRGARRILPRGAAGPPGLPDPSPVGAPDPVNMTPAPPAVLTALGLSAAEISEIVATRVRVPYAVVPARFGGKGLGVSSATFRIEAEGRVGGEPRARLVAIVQRQAQLTITGGSSSKIPLPSWRLGEP